MTTPFRPFPKPSPRTHKAKKVGQKKELSLYRHSQAALAIFRDDGLCAICFIKYERRTPYSDVHHVYGRGKRAGDSRENYKSLLCVCRACHPSPSKEPGGKLAWVEDILAQANAKPINPQFVPVGV